MSYIFVFIGYHLLNGSKAIEKNMRKGYNSDHSFDSAFFDISIEAIVVSFIITLAYIYNKETSFAERFKGIRLITIMSVLLAVIVYYSFGKSDENWEIKPMVVTGSDSTIKANNFDTAFVCTLTIDRDMNAIESKSGLKRIKKQIRYNENFILVYQYNTDSVNTKFIQPDFIHFKVQDSPNASQVMNWTGSKTEIHVTFSYILKPKSLGTFLIKPASIRLSDNKTFYSDSIEIEVVGNK